MDNIWTASFNKNIIQKHIDYEKIIDELIKKYKTLKTMNIISKNGCSEEDILYSQFLLGQKNILDNILEDLEKARGIKNE